MKRTILASSLLLLSAASAWAQAQPAPQPPTPAVLTSPEVHADNSVTFRFRDPNAHEVTLTLEGAKPAPMQKDDQGVWSLTTAPLTPDFYGYSFVADGVGLIDPSNPSMKPNLLHTESQVHVPGPASLPWEIGDVPHGLVHHHYFYKSGVVGDERDFFVYTPPGYDPKAKRSYPVLYLLHGFSDDASGWTAVGRANVILDNLIAQGKTKPMVVVTPLGYGVPEIVVPGPRAFAPELRKKNYDRFIQALFTEVMPQVESAYRVSKERKSRAIAGLSMGGAESLLTGLNDLDKFAWVGTFSSGGITENFDAEFPGLDAKANDKLRVLWIACGTDDHLIEPNRKLRAWLDSKGVHNTPIETPGGHVWMVWRRNLAEFSGLLFR